MRIAPPIHEELSIYHFFAEKTCQNDEPENQDLTPLIERREKLTPTRVLRDMGAIGLSMCGVHNPEVAERNELAGAELLLAEWIHMGFVAFGDEKAIEYCSQRLDIPAERVEEIIRMVEQDIDETVDEVHEAVQRIYADDTLRAEISEQLESDIYLDTSPLVVAGLLVSEAAHEGGFRHNGPRTFEHAKEVAEVLQTSVDASVATLGVTPEFKHIEQLVFTALVHDAWEDLIKKDGTSPLDGDQLHASPLFIYRVLLKFGVDQEEATALIKDLASVTKYRDHEGKTFPKGVYMTRCNSTIRSKLVKAADNTSNATDPKKIDPDTMTDEAIAKIKKTEKDYNAQFEELSTGLDKQFNDPFGHEVMGHIREIRESPAAFKTMRRTIALGRKTLTMAAGLSLSRVSPTEHRLIRRRPMRARGRR